MTDTPRQAADKVRKFGARFREEIRRSFRLEMELLATHIKEQHLTGGTTATKLHVRTGDLRASIAPAPVQVRTTEIETGINVGTVYGRMHFGRPGSKTVIRPVNRRWLTIPLAAAKDKGGVARGSARSGMWGETFFRRTAKGNLILFGKRVTQRGSSAGQTRGKIVPLFLLVKKVEIPARVDPERLLRWSEPRLAAAFRASAARSAEG